MRNISIKQLVANHWRTVLLGTASVTLTACVAKETGSSSSAESSSSAAVMSSSSTAPVSSAPSSSSVASSSMAPVSSSSMAPSSSSVASSSVQNCEEPDTAKFEAGQTAYQGGLCVTCHGQPATNGKTAGAAKGPIDATKLSFDGKTLADYIATDMAPYLPAACSSNTQQCGDDIAHYLKIATGAVPTPAACESSSSVASSTPPSSSSVASSSTPAGNCSDAVFCEDFENGVGAWGTSGDVSLTTEKVYEGSKALKVAAKGGSYNRNFISLDLSKIASTQSAMYGRMMLNVNTPAGNGGDFVFVQAEGAPDASDSNAPAGTNVMYRYRVNGSNGNLMANYDTYNSAGSWTTDCWDHSTVKMPTDQWSCLEWHFDSDANELKFWLDGNELSELHVQGTGEDCKGTAENGIWQAPAKFDTLHLGIEQYHNGVPARTMYIDDVKVDTKYIGCPDVMQPSSSSSVSSQSTGGSSSSAPATGSALSCDFSVSQDGGYYFEVKPVTITNSGSTTVNNWSVDIDLGSTSGSNFQIYARNGVSDATVTGSVLTIKGPSLAAGASATLDFGMNFSNHKVGTPSCAADGEAASSSSVASSSTGTGTSSSTGTPPDPGAGFIVENFENGTLKAVPAGWRTFVGYVPDNNNAASQIYVDNTRAHSGTKSLKVDGGAGPAQIVKAIPAGVDRVYMRAWVYMDRKMGNDPSDNHEHIFAMKQNESGSFSANAEVRVGQGKGHLGFNLVPDGDAISPTLAKWYSGPETPVNEWYCAEAAFITDTAYDELHFYVNGQLVNAVKSAADWHAPVGADWLTGDLGFAAFGWHSFSSHSVTMWMDDIIVSESPIGCN